jgi:hypothetical protein
VPEDVSARDPDLGGEAGSGELAQAAFADDLDRGVGDLAAAVGGRLALGSQGGSISE